MTDTDGILDRCQCGERASVEYCSNSVRAVCKSCGYSTRWWISSFEVMVEWNRYQRNIGHAKKVAADEK